MRLSGGVNVRALVPLAWILWFVLLLGLVFITFRISTERTSSPEGGRGIGLLVAGLMFLGLAVTGALVWWFARKPSPVGREARDALSDCPARPRAGDQGVQGTPLHASPGGGG